MQNLQTAGQEVRLRVFLLVCLVMVIGLLLLDNFWEVVVLLEDENLKRVKESGPHR